MEVYYNRHVFLGDKDLGKCFRTIIIENPERERDVVFVKQNKEDQFSSCFDFDCLEVERDKLIFARSINAR